MATKKPHIMVVEARFYAEISDALLEGAEHALKKAGASHEKFSVPGAISLTAKSGRYCAFVALGVVIRGETYHFEIVAGESARALMELTVQGFAIGNGILTVENEDQAWARARMTEKDKGGGAAEAALAMVAIRRKFGLTN